MKGRRQINERGTIDERKNFIKQNERVTITL
jgi:hypothetical protein